MSENLVLVLGATGGVGQLVVGNLLVKNLPVRILIRNSTTARNMFKDKVEIILGDIRHPETLPPAMEDIAYIICATGTTAFPSTKWEFDPPPNFIEWAQILLDGEFRNARAKNSPIKVDVEGVSNLVAAAPPNLQRFILVSSCGIERKYQPPFSILNAFGVLDAKQKAEKSIITSGFPYTIPLFAPVG